MKIRTLTTALALSAILLTVALFTGCASLQKVNSHAIAAEIIAKDATFFSLKKHPEWSPYFEVARQDLDVLAKTEKVDVAALSEIVARLPIEELKNDEARLIIGDVGIILQNILPNDGTIIKEEHLNNVREVVIALRDGIKKGLSLRGL